MLEYYIYKSILRNCVRSLNSTTAVCFTRYDKCQFFVNWWLLKDVLLG